MYSKLTTMDCTSPVFGIYPCGKCVNCLARSRQEWIFRLRMEYESSDLGLFVTLTYNDELLPPDGVSKSDVQLFLKRLRKNYKSQTLRYFIVSEYGDHGQRAHYHALLFFRNLSRDVVIYDEIEGAWQKGFVQFGEIEEGSIVYCTKYCLKGSDVPPGMNKNFRLLSKMHGGIGISYVDKNAAYHLPKLDKPQICTSRESTSPMPRYYRTKLLNSLDECDKEMIKSLYLENLDKCREKQKKKLLTKFRETFPGVDPDEPLVIHTEYGDFPSKRTRFQDWITQRNNLKEDKIKLHTKKQNLL